ncbi:MAG TPA: hypothetical protein VMI31_15755, partial [Fimbriimonadaceae bacterium]|nr:hypothetical protein [Fimbriimonadaceae bacterium]
MRRVLARRVSNPVALLAIAVALTAAGLWWSTSRTPHWAPLRSRVIVCAQEERHKTGLWPESMATLGPCLAKGGVDPTSLLLVSVLPSEDGASIEYRMREGSVDFHATARRSTPDIGVDEAGAKLKGMWCTLSKQPFVLTGGDKIVPALGRPFWRIAFLAGRIPYEAAVDAETSKVLWIEWNAGPGAGPTPFPDEKVARTRWEIEQDVLRYVNLVRQGRPVALHGIGPPIRGVVLARFDTAVNGLRTFPETCG